MGFFLGKSIVLVFSLSCPSYSQLLTITCLPSVCSEEFEVLMHYFSLNSVAEYKPYTTIRSIVHICV